MRKILCLLFFFSFAAAEPELQKEFELLKSTSVAVRRTAVKKIGRMRRPQAVSELSEVLGNDSNFGVRAQAAEALGSIRNRAATPALVRALADENRNVKASVIIAGLKISAVNVLGVIGDERSLPMLVKLLKDKNPRIKTISAQALGRLRKSAAIEPLLKSSRDKTQKVRLYSIKAIGEIGDKSAVKDLEKLLKTEKDDKVKVALARSLGRLGSAKGFPIALSAAGSKDLKLKREGIRALGVIRKVTPAVKEIIIEAWKSQDKRLKRDAERAASPLKIKLPEPEKKKEIKKKK